MSDIVIAAAKRTAIGSFLGARLTSLYVPSGRLKQIFGVLIVVMTAYKIHTVFR